MPLNDQLIEELTPNNLPPLEELKDQFLKLKGEAKDKRDYSRRNRWAWTQYLRMMDFLRPIMKFTGIEYTRLDEYKNAWHFGVGLVPTLGMDIKGPDYIMPAIKESQYTWGAIIFVNPFEEQLVLNSVLDFRNGKFPIIVAPVEIERHSLFLNSTRNSSIGTRTAWASARQTFVSPASMEGLLTARHVPDDCNQQKLWSQEASADFTVYRKGSPYIDAAYLEGSWSGIYPKRAFSRYISAMASGDPVDLDGAFTQASGYMTHLPSANHIGSGTPSHIHLTVSGQPGDSGGMISSQSDPVSMYLGSSRGKDGTIEGISLALEQIESELEVDLYL